MGLVAVVIAVTFKCVPLFRVTEVPYLVPSKDDLCLSIFQAWVWWLW